MTENQNLGSKLVQAGKLTAQQLEHALRLQRHLEDSGYGYKRLADILTKHFVSEGDLVDVLRDEVSSSTAAAVPLDIPAILCQRLRLKVLGVLAGELLVAPLNKLREVELAELKDAAFRSGVAISRVVEVPLDQAEILRALKEKTVDSFSLEGDVRLFNRNPEDGDVSELITALVQDAIQSRASDIHIDRDSDPEGCGVWFRVDGTMRCRFMLTPASAGIMVSRLKNEAGMDFSDSLHPQDGRMAVQFQGRKVDVRVAAVPTSGEGETLALRVLDPNNQKRIDILLREHPQELRELVLATQMTAGLILITGPTGTGKSTTMYGAIKSMNLNELNVMTSEDPIEQLIPGIRQTVLNEAAGLGYSQILRAQMRQDPDVLVVGEVRDTDTAEAILRGAESGHLMLATVHASSVVGATARVMSMLSPGFKHVGLDALANHLKAVTNQRLEPRVCSCAKHARAADAMDENSLGFFGLDPEQPIAVKAGCEKCYGTGYFGRVLVPEAMFMDANESTRMAIHEILKEGRGLDELIRVKGVRYYSRRDAASRLLTAGIIDIHKALHVTGDNH